MKQLVIFSSFTNLILLYPFLCYSDEDLDFSCDVEETMEQLGRTYLPGQLWPQGRIPFVIESSLGPSDKETFQSAIADYHKYTCVRFRPKTSQDKDYMTVRVVFNSTSCGSAVLCYNKNIGGHFVKIGCRRKRTWVHEIGHTLCLGHEQSRSDRNEFLSFEDCNTPPKIPTKQQLRGQIYDYYSVMHYPCFGKCLGKPIRDTKYVKRCGAKNNDAGLSVLDIEKINEYYSCFDGCKRHRWYNVKNLTQSQMKAVVNFASRKGDDEPIYLCRGYGAGDISVGWYRPRVKTCHVSALGSTLNVTEHIQLFALPRGSNKITRSSKPYRLYSNARNNSISKYLPLGRDLNHEHIFGATGEVIWKNGKPKTVLGRVNSNYMRWIYIPGLVDYDVFALEQFEVIGCSE